MNDLMEKRFSYIDYAKGFAIVLMIFSHTMAGEYNIKTWICSFHMPIFLIICGILTQMRYRSGYTQWRDIKQMFSRRFRQLGVPYLVFCVILMLFYCGLNLFSGRVIEWQSYLFRIVSLQGIDSLWFIPCYFAAELLLYLSLVSLNVRSMTTGLVAVAIIVLCVYQGEMPSLWFYRLLLKMLICYCFAYIGYWIGKFDSIQKLSAWGSIVLMILGVVLSLYNGFTAIGSLELNNGMLFFFNATVTSVAVFGLFYRIEEHNIKFGILSFYGRNSIVLLCTNNILIETIRLLDYKLTGNLLLGAGMVGCIIFTVILLMLEVPLIKISMSRWGVLFGKMPMKVSNP